MTLNGWIKKRNLVSNEMDGVNQNFRGSIYLYGIFFFGENLLKGAVQTIACVSQSWHLAILNV